jgi:serine/threonine protein kinase
MQHALGGLVAYPTVLRPVSADVQTPRWRIDLSLDAVVCRDLKSSNILLTKEGVAKIGDVGLAKTMVSDYFSWETAVGTCESLFPHFARVPDAEAAATERLFV